MWVDVCWHLPTQFPATHTHMHSNVVSRTFVTCPLATPKVLLLNTTTHKECKNNDVTLNEWQTDRKHIKSTAFAISSVCYVVCLSDCVPSSSPLHRVNDWNKTEIFITLNGFKSGWGAGWMGKYAPWHKDVYGTFQHQTNPHPSPLNHHINRYARA